MRAGIAFLAASLLAMPVTAQTITSREATPPRVASVTIPSTDGSGNLSAPIMTTLCSNGATAVICPIGGLDPETVAVRAGRAFTVSTGRATVAAGNVLCIYLENTGTSTYYFTTRLFSNNLPSNVAQPYVFGISATGGNLPVSTASISNRNGSAAAPGLVARFGVSTPANQPSGTVGPGNYVGAGHLELGQPYTRTLTPGSRFANCQEGGSTGLTGNTDAMEAITISLYYE